MVYHFPSVLKIQVAVPQFHDLYIQLTLEQNEFELHRPTNTWVVFNEYRWPSESVGFTSTGLVFKEGAKPVISIHSWQSRDVKGRLSALFYTNLYRALEHPQILVYMELVSWRQTSSDTEGRL